MLYFLFIYLLETYVDYLKKRKQQQMLLFSELPVERPADIVYSHLNIEPFFYNNYIAGNNLSHTNHY